jgi:hypothetical protein
MVTNTYNLSTQQEDQEFKASLGYTARPYLKKQRKKKKKEKQVFSKFIHLYLDKNIQITFHKHLYHVTLLFLTASASFVAV